MYRRAVVVSLAVSSLALGQPAPHPLGKTIAQFPLNAWASSIHELPDGRVLVADSSRRLVLLDSSLRFIRVVVEAPPPPLKKFPQSALLVPYQNGGALYLDGVGETVTVVSPDGLAAPPVALPRHDDMEGIWGRLGGIPGADSTGQIIYAVRQLIPGQAMPWLIQNDSAIIVAISPFSPRSTSPGARGAYPIVRVVEHRVVDSLDRLRPMVANDAWAVVNSDIIIIRASDFALERWSTDGKLTAYARIPYERLALTPADKASIVDSTRQKQQAGADLHPPLTLMSPRAITRMVEPHDLPDTLPPFVRTALTNGDALASPDGSLWIIQNQRYRGDYARIALVIDASTNFGVVKDRVAIPARKSILGFGKNCVYLWHSFGPLEKVAIRDQTRP